HDNLVLLTNRGRAIPLRMSQVPDVTRNPTGYSIKNQLEPDERLIAALPINNAKVLVMATSGGKIKRTGIEEFANLQAGGIRAINLGEGDELGWALAGQGGGELLLVTAQGQALRFKEEDVPVQGRAAAGVWAIKLAEGDRVVALEPCSPDGWLTVASERGFAKRTALKDFPVKGRYTSGVGAFPVETRTGPLAAATVVDLEDDLMLITAGGTVLRIRAENIAKGNRGARGKLLLEPKGEDKVADIACVVGRIEKSAEEAGGTEEPGEPVKTGESAVQPNGHEPKAKSEDGGGPRAEKDGRKSESKKPKGKPEPKARREPEEKPKPAARAKSESKPRARAADGKRAKAAEPPAATESKPAAKKAEPKGETSDKQMELDIPLNSFKPLPKKKK
ncbi:MAG: DNA gyrase C-terminal beta-propeller domain-containing protein, partial [Rudaea sp.]